MGDSAGAFGDTATTVAYTNADRTSRQSLNLRPSNYSPEENSANANRQPAGLARLSAQSRGGAGQKSSKTSLRTSVFVEDSDQAVPMPIRGGGGLAGKLKSASVRGGQKVSASLHASAGADGPNRENVLAVQTPEEDDGFLSEDPFEAYRG